ncbi:hypothetical protein EDEG_01651 [Edhazardia aedis USNM 41457]|uniref:Uncharacterized protein n=1 Tax=Edhazardia aedis (strain USNM 41457) TaxID=1003232 RepID=J9DNH0_EDHAE|nr:hypothetical protein EDEG_01651 [Edhazardia aedis USNM 41457]|eukprot:EJW04075.1 hypothetical protein EDEG_01651 [Edhazardia aedis USNM 41457]
MFFLFVFLKAFDVYKSHFNDFNKDLENSHLKLDQNHTVYIRKFLNESNKKANTISKSYKNEERPQENHSIAEELALTEKNKEKNDDELIQGIIKIYAKLKLFKHKSTKKVTYELLRQSIDAEMNNTVDSFSTALDQIFKHQNLINKLLCNLIDNGLSNDFVEVKILCRIIQLQKELEYFNSNNDKIEICEFLKKTTKSIIELRRLLLCFLFAVKTINYSEMCYTEKNVNICVQMTILLFFSMKETFKFHVNYKEIVVKFGRKALDSKDKKELKDVHEQLYRDINILLDDFSYPI